jgi:hypothetical protein
MQQIQPHLTSSIKPIIKSNEISQMENHELVHCQIFIPNHLIIIHVYGILMMTIHMIGVIHHIQPKEMIINHQLIYHYQKQ